MEKDVNREAVTLATKNDAKRGNCSTNGCRNEVEQSRKCLQCTEIYFLRQALKRLNDENNEMLEHIIALETRVTKKRRHGPSEKEAMIEDSANKKKSKDKLNIIDTSPSVKNNKADATTMSAKNNQRNIESLLHDMQSAVKKQFIEMQDFVTNSIKERIKKINQAPSQVTYASKLASDIKQASVQPSSEVTSFRLIMMNAIN